MKPYFVLLLLLLGCVPPAHFTPYFTKEYDTNEVKEATVGSVMMAWEYGDYSNISYTKYDGIRRELIYVGAVQDVIQISYREYYIMRDYTYAKQAFSQEFRYDLSKTSMIVYQDVRIQVSAYDSEKIRYRVTRGPKYFEEYIKTARELPY